VLFELVDGALELVVECELDVVAALASAAPPPTSAPVTASVVRRGLIRWLTVIHLLWLALDANHRQRSSENRRRPLRVALISLPRG
jgi:hypothetical protein